MNAASGRTLCSGIRAKLARTSWTRRSTSPRAFTVVTVSSAFHVLNFTVVTLWTSQVRYLSLLLPEVGETCLT